MVMTNEQRLAEAEKLAVRIKERDDVRKRGRHCARCRHLRGAEPSYSFVGKEQFCRNPVVRESPGHKTHLDDKAIHINRARDNDGLCGPDALFWQPTISAAITDFIGGLS